MRYRYPEADRSYLQTMEAIEYTIGEITKALKLGCDDPDPDGFKAAVRYAEHLYQLIRIAAIARDRQLRNN